MKMPLFSYFFVIGSVLVAVLFYANRTIAPVPLPFSVSQRTGLPEPYKAPMVVLEAPKPAVIATRVERTVEAKKPVKLVREHKPTRTAPHAVPQGHYAAYPRRDYGSIW